MANFESVAASLEAAGERLSAMFLANAWNLDMPMIQLLGWNAPAISANEVVTQIQELAQRIRSIDSEAPKEVRAFLGRIEERANLITYVNLNADSDAVIGSVLDFLTWVDTKLPPRPAPIDWETVKDTDLLPRDLKRRLRSVAAHLAEMEPKSGTLQQKIAEIEDAHAAAEQLPTDMQELAAQKEALRTIAEDVGRLADKVEKRVSNAGIAEEEVRSILEQLKGKEIEATKLIAQCEEAYRTTTSKGLAGAFEKRAVSLNFSAWVWVLALAAALLCGFLIGFERFQSLRDVLRPGVSGSVIWVNALMAVLGVGAPVWFAWLATKQLGQSFRLAEDYAFKASVAKAYEGYRREAAKLDPALEQRLFGSALTRLEEPPIRLVEAQSHSSPLQELLSSPALKEALATMPDLKDRILALVSSKG